MYIAAMKTKFAKQDQENLAIKIQVWEKQHPQTKSSLEDMEILSKKVIKNMTKLTRRTRETFQMR